jgi:hypothetical protein
VDYGYHNNYTEERQLWQDKIIHSVVYKTAAQATPWIVYTCGPMGAGKGYALTWMSDNGYFPLEKIVHIDPDHFKSVMTEWVGYTERDTSSAGSFCHAESAFIQELAQEVALSKMQNLWVDGSLRNGKWFKEVYTDIRERYPRYRIAIFYVFADEKIIRERVKRREQLTGRGVPEAELLDSLQAPDRSLGMLVSHVDFIARINNNGTIPYLTAFETVNTTGGWASISNQFAKTQADPTEFPESLAPLWLNALTIVHEHFEWPAGLIESVTDVRNDRSHEVKVSPTFWPPGTSMGNLSDFMKNMVVRLDPAFPVNLDTETRKLAGIPEMAHSFVYCSGLDHVASTRSKERWFRAVQGEWARKASPTTDLISLTSARGLRRLNINIDDVMTSFVMGGGFLYFDINRRVCGATANANTHDFRKLSATLQFGNACILSDVDSAKVLKILEYRMARVTKSFIMSKGAWRYAFVRPGETFGDLFKNPFGGFLYEFDETENSQCRFYPILSEAVD